MRSEFGMRPELITESAREGEGAMLVIEGETALVIEGSMLVSVVLLFHFCEVDQLQRQRPTLAAIIAAAQQNDTSSSESDLEPPLPMRRIQ